LCWALFGLQNAGKTVHQKVHGNFLISSSISRYSFTRQKKDKLLFFALSLWSIPAAGMGVRKGGMGALPPEF